MGEYLEFVEIEPKPRTKFHGMVLGISILSSMELERYSIGFDEGSL